MLLSEWATGVSWFLNAFGTFNATAEPDFASPRSDAVDHVNPLIGNGGDSPNGSGGMIPSTAPPFAMTRWTAQTRENFVSVTPYNHSDTSIHGFQGTHQPAIWMGESGQVVVVPGMGAVKPAFGDRGMTFSHDDELATASYYRVLLRLGARREITVEQSATSRVGHLRFAFHDPDGDNAPYVILQVTRASVLRHTDPLNTTSPVGDVAIDHARREVSGRNPERQDHILGPSPAPSFAGYFVARFDPPFDSFGTATGSTLRADESARTGTELAGYVRFAPGTRRVDVRIGVSFISIAQARANLDAEVPDGTPLEVTARTTRAAWAEKLDRIMLEGATREQKVTFYTAVFHSLQYPHEQSEGGRYYSGYDDQIHDGESYSGYSNWDTFRAQWALLIMLAPERINGMVRSMLQDFEEGGWLPMWKNTCCETNIMVGTHADSLVAEALVKGFRGFDTEVAYAALRKDATVPPENDTTIQYFDREEGVGFEVRAGLTSFYAQNGWVADELHSESASRTIDYSYDDYAVSVAARILGHEDDAAFFGARSANYKTLWNAETGFIEARRGDGSWAGPDAGFTEGDKWCYTLAVLHDVPGLMELLGGRERFVAFLDEHFLGGHNDHSNEPSHHIPYLYAMAGAPTEAQARVRQLARDEYNATVFGLSGNEDCGQMSAWFIWSALGFYPVNPVSGTYVVGSPLFDKVTLKLPGSRTPLVVVAPEAPHKAYVRSLALNGVAVARPTLRHEDIAEGGTLTFIMSDAPERWGTFPD